MNELEIYFVEGCAKNDKGYSDVTHDGTDVGFNIFRIQNTLYARRIDEDHITLSCDLKPLNLWKVCREYWVEWHRTQGETLEFVCEDDTPSDKGNRTKRIHKELIEAGVLKK